MPERFGALAPAVSRLHMPDRWCTLRTIIKKAPKSSIRKPTEEKTMNLLMLAGLIILAYWVIAIAWVATREDWE